MFYCYFNRKGPLEYVYLGQVELLIVATGPMCCIRNVDLIDIRREVVIRAERYDYNVLEL